MLNKVISGGQTGVDRAGLDAAMEAGFPVGGWCPKVRLAEDGTVPDKYPLVEMGSASYLNEFGFFRQYRFSRNVGFIFYDYSRK
jgi:predicted Rossmann-fold nucleotide-binding protein